MKAALTSKEKLTAAYLHYVHGVEQQVIAIAMGVNIGRVNEACLAVERALQAPKVSRRQAIRKALRLVNNE